MESALLSAGGAIHLPLPEFSGMTTHLLWRYSTDFSYTAEEIRFRERLNEFLDQEMTEEIARQNWEEEGVSREAREFSLKLAAYGFRGWDGPRNTAAKG